MFQQKLSSFIYILRRNAFYFVKLENLYYYSHRIHFYLNFTQLLKSQTIINNKYYIILSLQCFGFNKNQYFISFHLIIVEHLFRHCNYLNSYCYSSYTLL